jgi:alpha-amylase/alpha-mannosidase (GH57 family)
VHGHFYQPPRENPWLETVEVEDSAAPYHDWNERISAECYAPNSASRITNRKGEIVRIMNNYARMSFNFGPTLLKWMADKTPRTYRTILDADRASAQRYGGHGSAIAQVYNHIILPLASRRDAVTQIRWGTADFEHRFGRRPEGMWLAETAVNRGVLE